MPEARGIRFVALALLDEAERAARALAADRRPKALRHFRVALRRLRSWLRAFKDELKGTVKRGDRSALREITAATNLGRDRDMQHKWLTQAAKGWNRKPKQSRRWLADYLAEHRRKAGDSVDDALLSEFERVREKLARRLSTYQLSVREGDSGPHLAAAIAGRVRPHSTALAEALDAVRSVADEKQAHGARIAAKRLRYLIEPAAPHVKSGPGILEQLKSLQDELGALHDAHVIGQELRDALAAAAKKKAARGSKAAKKQLLAMEVRVDSDAENSFTVVQTHWLDGRYRRFNRRVAAFAKRLKRV